MRESDNYIKIVTDTINKAYNSQREQFTKAATLIADVIEAKKSVYIFGCSHAGIVAEDLFYRAGGLAVINPIFFPGFMLNTRPVTLTSDLEKVDGIAKNLLVENHVKPGDVIIIHSVSGRNNVPVEMALTAKEMGLHTIALTSIAGSSSVKSKHPSGKRLFEIADIVFDNCGVKGDAAVQPAGLSQPMAPTSSAVGTSLMNAMIVEAVEILLERGIEPPIFKSANLDGGEEWNNRIFEEYKDSIFYM